MLLPGVEVLNVGGWIGGGVGRTGGGVLRVLLEGLHLLLHLSY